MKRSSSVLFIVLSFLFYIKTFALSVPVQKAAQRKGKWFRVVEFS